MKINTWTVGLAAAGVVSLGSIAQAEEAAKAVMTALSSTTLSGYVDTSAMWNPGTGNGNSPAFAFNSGKQDGFNVNAVVLTLEKPLDEAQWAAGYKVQLALGPDAGIVTGEGDDWSSTAYMKQAYVVLRAPVGTGLDFKIGRFDTIIGYEVFESGNNPNYTRSYGYTMEPTQHTGVLMSYRFSDSFSGSVGMANTSSTGYINERNTGAESQKTYMASLAFTAPDSAGFLAGTSIYGGVISGLPHSSTGYDGTTPIWLYAGTTIATGVEGLRFGFSYDYTGASTDEDDVTRDEGYWANALAGYISFNMTEKLSTHVRAEYAWMDEDLEDDGLPSKIFALTATIQYDLWANVVSRLELRWDTAADGSRPYGGGGNDAEKNAVMVAFNAIYKF